LREIHPREKRIPFSLPQYWGNNRNPVKAVRSEEAATLIK
jgi:hypothetical protein